MRRLRRYAISRIALALALAPGAPALAQTGTEIEELVVTARKREERLQDIPAAGSAISAARIEEAGGIQDLRSLSAFLPGVSLVDNDGANSEFAIRGAGQAGRSINADAAIALLRNGAQVTGGNIGGRGFARMDFFDLARIEVLRGAQGSLYGTNAVGGIISIVSREPSTTLGGQVQAGYNFDKDGYDLIAIVNAPITEALAFRGGVDLTEQVKGEVYNTFRREWADSSSYRGARASLAWRPSPNWQAVGSIDVSRLDDPTGGQVDVQRRYYTAIPETHDYLSQVEGNTKANLRQNIANAALVVKGDLGFAELTAITNYRWRDSTSVSDDDGRYPGAPVLANGQPNIAGGANCRNNNCSSVFADQVNVFFQEFRLSGGERGLTWQVGADLRDLTDDYSIRNFGRRTATAAVLPQYQLLLSDNRTLGAFGSISYALTPTLTVEGSSRYTRDRKEFEGGLSSGGFAIGSIPFRSRTFTNITYGTSLSWKPSSDTNIYARAATGFRAGGFNRDTGLSELPGSPPTPQAYQEEGTRAYELGAKQRLSRAVSLSISAFYSEYTDVLVVEQGLRPVSQGGGAFNYLDNFGDAWAKGIDVEMIGSVRGFLSSAGRIDYNIAGVWVDSKLNSPITSVDGRQLNGTPDFAMTVNGTFSHPISDRFAGFLNLTFQGEWGGWRNLSNTTERDTARNLQLRAGVRGPNRFEVALRLTNVLNDRYRFLTGTGFYSERPDRQLTLQVRKDF